MKIMNDWEGIRHTSQKKRPRKKIKTDTDDFDKYVMRAASHSLYITQGKG
jgi:predicted component of type VI protein secretion system